MVRTLSLISPLFLTQASMFFNRQVRVSKGLQ
jgi:hypothetical protein